LGGSGAYNESAMGASARLPERFSGLGRTVTIYSQDSSGRSSAGPAKEEILIRNHRFVGRLLLILGLLLPGAAGAQELYTYTVGVLGGIGGSFDAEPGDSLTNTGFQVNLGMITEPGTHLVLRTGRLSLDQDEFFGSLRDAELKYATIGGEYRNRETYFESGIYIALGGYRLEGTRATGQDARESSWGLSVGATGELPITKWLGLQAEISGHYIDFDEAQFFAMGHAGVVFHF